jgi:predicted ATP-grasp superfamily ATP-dependent carboligase
MDELVNLEIKPKADEIYMIAGWRQWADAGEISSSLPQYLIDLTGAKKIGEIDPFDFYLFQIPGTHHFLRPEIKLEEGYRKNLETRRNEFFYSGNDKKGLVIFMGEEPHMKAERYAQALLNAVKELGVKRVVAVGGVHGPVPFDKEREISCVYSLPEMKAELAEYAVRFSNYEGGTTIGTFLVDQAEKSKVEFLVYYAFVPAYDFSEFAEKSQIMRVETDYKAWYDVVKRINHMFGLELDLSELEDRSDELVSVINDKLDALEKTIPELGIREYLSKLTDDFTERAFMPLDEIWKKGLEDLFNEIDD